MMEGAPDAPCFERFFTSAALQCHAIVFTSQSLIENDVHLSARASTEILAGELLQRFAQVLLDDEVAREIVSMRTTSCAPKHPRCYALGSAGASKTYPTVGLADLVRQRELTFNSFGKPILRPLIIGLGLDERSAEGLRMQITTQTNMIFLNSSVASDENTEWLKLITLWPFDPDYGPWPG